MSNKHYIHCEVPEDLKQAIEQRCQTTDQTLKQIVIDALKQYLQIYQGSLFQVSTINALVEGINEEDTTITNPNFRWLYRRQLTLSKQIFHRTRVLS